VQSHENVWHQRLHTQVYIRGTLGIRRVHSNYANIRRCTAMVTNHQRPPYGVYFIKNRTILRRPYVVRLAAGRIARFLIIFRHRTVPGEMSQTERRPGFAKVHIAFT